MHRHASRLLGAQPRIVNPDLVNFSASAVAIHTGLSLWTGMSFANSCRSHTSQSTRFLILIHIHTSKLVKRRLRQTHRTHIHLALLALQLDEDILPRYAIRTAGHCADRS
jgi:hypothetical protein